MLILSRRVTEAIVIDGRIVVKILRIEGDQVKIGIQAPPELAVHRQEIHDMIQKGKRGQEAGQSTGSNLPEPGTAPPSDKTNSG